MGVEKGAGGGTGTGVGVGAGARVGVGAGAGVVPFWNVDVLNILAGVDPERRGSAKGSVGMQRKTRGGVRPKDNTRVMLRGE